MNECPEVVGMMSAAIEGGGSLDAAVREVAAGGPERSSAIFREAVFMADARVAGDVKSAMGEALSKVPESAAPFKRALRMVFAASESPSRSEKKRMLDGASEIALGGLRDLGEAYGSSLNAPCMAVFGLGIMVPMVLMSILPMLSMGGVFGPSPVDSGAVAVLTIAVIPCAILSLSLSIRSRNPFAPPAGGRAGLAGLALLSAAPLSAILWAATGDAASSVMAASAAAGILTFALMAGGARRERARAARESMLRESVFDLGGRLIAGENFEAAARGAVGERRGCARVAESLSRELHLCRGDVRGALERALGPISGQMAGVFCRIQRSSEKDSRDAGRLAVSIGRQLQDQDSVRKAINNRLKSMTDMMTGTAAVFAPLVLGLSVSMLAPVSRAMGGAGFGGASAVLSVYLAELCVLMALLTSHLGGGSGAREAAFRASAMLPVSMAVFFACSRLSL
jgi:hypothetical protein